MCVIDFVTKYVWVKPLKHKKNKTVLHGFIAKWSREIFVIDYVMKTNSWTNKIKDIRG